jgi:hypothetical protein
MPTKLDFVSKKDAVEVIKAAKGRNQKSLDEFYYVSDGTKNNIKNLPFDSQRTMTGFCGNKKVKMIIWT